MKKPERIKLHKQMHKLLSRLGGELKVIDERSLETTSSPGEYGRIRVAFYNGRDAKDTPWLSCSLADWPATVEFARQWQGFRHWKQNEYAFGVETAAFAVELFTSHLRKLGLSKQIDEVDDVTTRS